MDAAELQAERDALTAEIHAAFEGVSREGGVSWSETFALDQCCPTQEECDRARAMDQDEGWVELVDDSEWNEQPLSGGFSYLDPIGFRYYLPVALVRSVRSGRDNGIRHALSLVPSRAIDKLRADFALSAKHHEDMNAYRLETWSLLSNRQCLCVARFLRHMIVLNSGKDHRWQDELRSWNETYESYWKSLE